jgi:hypothetical protein
LADVFTLQRRRAAAIAPDDERSFYLDTLAEYQWARGAAGLMPGTIDQLVKPVIELCEYYDTVPWRLQPKQCWRRQACVLRGVEGSLCKLPTLLSVTGNS